MTYFVTIVSLLTLSLNSYGSNELLTSCVEYETRDTVHIVKTKDSIDYKNVSEDIVNSLLFFDEGKTSIINNSKSLEVLNRDYMLRPFITPEGDFVSPLEINKVEIKVNKTTGEGSVVEISDNEISKKIRLIECK